MDLMKVAKILKGKTVHPDVSLVIAPGSKQVLTMLAENGALADLIAAGARLLESVVVLVLVWDKHQQQMLFLFVPFNRNFKGRCGTVSASVYLVSPETAAISAITGKLTDPRTINEDISVEMPDEFTIDDNMIIAPAEDPASVEVIQGPNIKPFPINNPLNDMVEGKVLIKVEDNITTDHIMPSNAKLLPFRSNIPYLAEFCLTPCNDAFPKEQKKMVEVL